MKKERQLVISGGELAGGFLTENELADVVKSNPHLTVLVRCGGGRFTCYAQDVEHFTNIIKAEGSDYVRDVSVRRGKYVT